MKPITQLGTSLERMSSERGTGETLSCSMVPTSFSPTVLSAVKAQPSSVSRITINPGTMKTL